MSQFNVHPRRRITRHAAKYHTVLSPLKVKCSRQRDITWSRTQVIRGKTYWIRVYNDMTDNNLTMVYYLPFDDQG
jgi:hypothetical protein